MVLANVAFDRPHGSFAVGDRTFIGRSTIVIADRIYIGSDVLMAWGVTVIDHNSHAIRFSERKDDVSNWMRGTKDWSHVSIEPVVIQDKVWIGLNAVVLQGVTIGEGSVVGAASVVTRDVPPWTVVAGNPARVIREIAPRER
jgi:galactoside O-acetyltransferase